MQKTRIGKHTSYTPVKTGYLGNRRELKKKKKLLSVLRDTTKDLECNITNKQLQKRNKKETWKLNI